MIAQISVLCFISMVAANPAYLVAGNRNLYEPTYISKARPYTFGFDVKDEYGTALNRQEQGDDLGNKIGSYGFIDANGISRQVEYVADDKGFRAAIKTNEPGTSNESPADVQMQANPLQYQPPRNTGASYAQSYGQGSRSVKLASDAYRATLVVKQETPLNRPVVAISTTLTPVAYGGVSSPNTPLPVSAKLTEVVKSGVSYRRVQVPPYSPLTVSANLATPSSSEVYRIQNPSYVRSAVSAKSIPTVYKSSVTGQDLSNKSGFASGKKRPFSNVQASPSAYRPFSASVKSASRISNVY